MLVMHGEQRLLGGAAFAFGEKAGEFVVASQFALLRERTAILTNSGLGWAIANSTYGAGVDQNPSSRYLERFFIIVVC